MAFSLPPPVTSRSYSPQGGDHSN